jgi:hypothetical protein
VRGLLPNPRSQSCVGPINFMSSNTFLRNAGSAIR